MKYKLKKLNNLFLSIERNSRHDSCGSPSDRRGHRPERRREVPREKRRGGRVAGLHGTRYQRRLENHHTA